MLSRLPSRRKKYVKRRTSLSRHRLAPRDVAAAIGVLVLACYLVFTEEETDLPPAGDVRLLSGIAEIVDGDSLKIRDERVRLSGIDAPEMRQTCLDAEKKLIMCGRLSKQHLEKLIRNRQVHCHWTERDRYDRILGLCQAGDSDLNRLMVEDGWAFSYYSSAYDNEQRLARKHKRGIWVWKVQRPQQWRRENMP